MSITLTEVDLTAGVTGESAVAATLCTVANDTTNTQYGDKSYKMTLTGTGTASIRFDPLNSTLADPFLSGKISRLNMRVWVEDASKVTNIGVGFIERLGGYVWERYASNMFAPFSTIVDGWNTFSWAASNSTLTYWGEFLRCNPYVIGSTGAVVSVDRIWGDVPSKAQVILIADHANHTFYENAWPDCVTNGWPVTWGPDIEKLGLFTGDDERMTLTDLRAVDGVNGSTINYHGYSGDVTSSMTEAELIADTQQSIDWLLAHGFAVERWRCAIVQNNADALDSNRTLLADNCGLQAQATYTESATDTSYPLPADRVLDIPRIALAGYTTGQIDAMLDRLEKYNGLVLIYNHGVVSVGGATHTSQATWDYFAAELASRSATIECTTLGALGVALVEANDTPVGVLDRVKYGVGLGLGLGLG